ncbi:MAG: cytochrome c oxidase subunit I, partial [Acidimicrobiales bacterium]
DEGNAAGGSAEPGPAPAPPGLAGWFTTSDHKRIGRLYLVTSLAFLVVGSVVGAILGIERIESGLQLLGDDTFSQVYTLHGEVAVLLFLVPFFLGLATYLVPLQLGAPDVAFPRGSATAYWAYVVAGATLLASYAANGGATGGSQVGADLYLLSLAVLAVATGLALVSILTTIVTLRAPGMTMLRAPLFSWSLLVGGGLTLLATPVLLARLIELYIQHHFTGEFVVGTYGGISWFWAVPQVYLLAVPAVGVAAEIVPVLARCRLRHHESGIVVIAATGLLGFGAWAQVDASFDDLLYVVAGLAAVLPALALLGILGDTVRRGALVRKAPLLMALGAVVHLFLGALAGAVSTISALELRGTAWEAAQLHYTLYGGAVLAAYAALWFWAPKIWGVHLGEGAGMATFLLTFWGAILLAAPDLFGGLVSDRSLMFVQSDEGFLTTALNGISALGGAMGVLGVLVVVGDLFNRVGRHAGTRAIGDPWGGPTLEWATTSPPPAGNFAGPLPPVRSAYPVADQAEEADIQPDDVAAIASGGGGRR